MIYKDGSYYIGWWKFGDYDGEGKKYEADGTVIEEGWFEGSQLLRPLEDQPKLLENLTAGFMNYNSNFGRRFLEENN